MTHTLLCTMRNEAPFVLEWVAYHRVIGFERFIVFSNDCDDGTAEILDALQNAGVITHISHTPDPNKPIAAQVAEKTLDAKLIAPGSWAMWLDADEFLNIHVGGSKLPGLIDAIGSHRGMCVSWRNFGVSEEEIFAGALIAEPFTKCAEQDRTLKNVKTFFRFDEDVKELFQHKPILARSFWDDGGSFMSSAGRALDPGTRLGQRWINGRKRGKIPIHEAGWQIAQVNHYAVRTRRLFKFKQERGRIGVSEDENRNRYSQKYFDAFNATSATDRSILRFAEATAIEAQRLAELIRPQCDVNALLRQTYPEDVLALHGEPTKTEVKTMPDAPPADAPPAAAKLYKNMHLSHHDEIDQRQYSNQKLAKAAMSVLQPGSVVDVGCGIGLLMSFMAKEGAEVTGLEGTWLEPEHMVLDPKYYQLMDLEEPFRLTKRYDLCSTIEVAEHLEPDRAEGFVDDLTQLSDVILFSAAIGGQGGKGHKNERWQEYWALKFEDRGYLTFDPFREGFRRDANMLPWFSQNVLVFAKEGNETAETLAADRITPAAANMILPTYHTKVLRRTRRSFRKRLKEAKSQNA